MTIHFHSQLNDTLNSESISPQTWSGVVTWQRFNEAIARRSKPTTSTPTKMSSTTSLPGSRGRDIFSVPREIPHRKVHDAKLPLSFSRNEKQEIEVDDLQEDEEADHSITSNDRVAPVRRAGFGIFHRSVSPVPSPLEDPDESIDLEALLKPDFWNDFYGEGIRVAEEIVEWQSEKENLVDDEEAPGSLANIIIDDDEREQQFTTSSDSLVAGSDLTDQVELENLIDSETTTDPFSDHSVRKEGLSFRVPTTHSVRFDAHIYPSSHTSMTRSTSHIQDLDFLVLGAGWLFQFLEPLLKSRNLSYAYTTTTGREGSIKFVFHSHPPEDSNSPTASNEKDQFSQLPRAKTVLITFPVKGKPALRRLVHGYENVNPQNTTQWILLGSTGVYALPPDHPPDSFRWFDNESDPTAPSERWDAEACLLEEFQGCVLNLSGLYGEPGRDRKIWERALPDSKEGLAAKKSVHFIHGRDVARVVLRVSEKGRFTCDRWVVTDGRVYDWWELAWERGGEADGERYRRWVLELMREGDVRALPRNVESLGRGLDGRAVWKCLGIVPLERKFGWVD